MPDGAPIVFISYSHDSEGHRAAVLALANRLRGLGIDVTIDQYVQAPAEGWPRWMTRHIEEADYVILVCTPIYHQRVSMNAPSGQGLGSLWESNIIYQLLYESQPVNKKFIAALPDGGKSQDIPAALRGGQRYLPFSEAGFWDLYRRLTEQPAVVKPALGERVALGPISLHAVEEPTSLPLSEVLMCSQSPRAAIMISEDNALSFPTAIEAHWGDQAVSFTFVVDDAEEMAVLNALRNRRAKVKLAYANNAADCVAESVSYRVKDGKELWEISFGITTAEFSNSTEFSMNGLTPDHAAILRARRLLLNEEPASESRDINDTMRELLLSANNSAMPIAESPFPKLYSVFGDRPQLFIEAARAFAVLQLKMSATVSEIITLSLSLRGTELQIDFFGKRRKVYSNQPAPVIQFSGVCALR